MLTLTSTIIGGRQTTQNHRAMIFHRRVETNIRKVCISTTAFRHTADKSTLRVIKSVDSNLSMDWLHWRTVQQSKNGFQIWMQHSSWSEWFGRSNGLLSVVKLEMAVTTSTFPSLEDPSSTNLTKPRNQSCNVWSGQNLPYTLIHSTGWSFRLIRNACG